VSTAKKATSAAIKSPIPAVNKQTAAKKVGTTASPAVRKSAKAAKTAALPRSTVSAKDYEHILKSIQKSRNKPSREARLK
jgi:hypothetical protein